MSSHQYVYVMHRLSKAWPGGKEVLKNISLSFLPGAKIGVLGLNGWSNAALFHKGFQLLLDSGEEITRENMVKAMNTMSNASVGGARGVTFSADDHRGTRQEGIIQYKDGEFVLVRDFQPYPAVAFDVAKSE